MRVTGLNNLDEDIVNPKRFVIMTLLFTLRQLTDAELSKASKIQWGSLTTHLKRLEKQRLHRKEESYYPKRAKNGC